MIDDAYLDIMEQLYGVLGEDAIVTATRLDDTSFTAVEVIASSDCLSSLSGILKEASEVRGFGMAFKAETCLPFIRYQITLYYLPLELDWIWNTVSPTPITLKTIVKKLKK